LTQYLAALTESLGTISVTVEVVLVEAAVTVVDAAAFELGWVLIPLRGVRALGRRLSLAAGTKALAVDGASLYPPIETIGEVTNALAAGETHFATLGARAPSAGDAVAGPSPRAWNRQEIVDIAVAVVVDAVADLFTGLAAFAVIVAGRRGRLVADVDRRVDACFDRRVSDRCLCFSDALARFFDSVGEQSRAPACR
jgi:hypothetical protein